MLKKIILGLLLAISVLFVSDQQILAGTDLTVNCSAVGSCSISPASTPIFAEFGWSPGSAVTQYFRLTNSSSQDGFTAIEVINYGNEINNLGEVVQIEIRESSPVGPIIYGGVTMHQFRDDGYFTIDSINNGQTIDYFLIASMPAAAGNKYQGGRLIFDLNMGLELEPIVPPSGGGDGGGGGGGGGGDAKPWVCPTDPPGSAPSLSISNVGTNTVTLNWTPVSPVTHYALVFTRDSDGAQYGSTNIGNVTSYTVSNLSGSDSYTFQVFGVNDCAPGPRSNAVSSYIPGPYIEGRPRGPGGEVLGVQEEELEASAAAQPAASPEAGEIAGAEDIRCLTWKLYLPLILLLVQAILFSEYYYKNKNTKIKYLPLILITLGSIAIFYYLRECECYSQSWLVWFCKYYWIPSVFLSVLLKIFAYAFLEDSEEEKS